jgi:hypothetical protein
MKISVWTFLAVCLLGNISASSIPNETSHSSAQNNSTAVVSDERHVQPGQSKRSNNEQLAKKIDAITRAPSSAMIEIAKMVEQGVAPDVILSFVENSSVAYSPSAADILYLHERGVPSQVITAVIRRGGELRANASRMYAENQNRNAVAPAKAGNSNQNISAAASMTQPAVSYVYNYPQPYPVYVPVTYPIYSSSYALPSYSIYSTYAYRPFYHHYPVSYYRSCYPRFSYGVSFGSRGSHARIGFGNSFGHFGRAGCRVR